jgi:hypothetical protein
MFEKLLKQWADEQGFQTWSQDHEAVLRNLILWLNKNSTQEKSEPYAKTIRSNEVAEDYSDLRT